MAFAQELSKRRVDSVDGNAGAGSDPASIWMKIPGAGETQDSFGILPNACLCQNPPFKSEPTPEKCYFARGQGTALAQNLRQSRMVGAEVSRKSAQRVARVALAALRELGFKTVSEIHALLLQRCGAGGQRGRLRKWGKPRL